MQDECSFEFSHTGPAGKAATVHSGDFALNLRVEAM